MLNFEIGQKVILKPFDECLKIYEDNPQLLSVRFINNHEGKTLQVKNTFKIAVGTQLVQVKSIYIRSACFTLKKPTVNQMAL